jgi:hypothetical protein
MEVLPPIFAKALSLIYSENIKGGEYGHPEELKLAQNYFVF